MENRVRATISKVTRRDIIEELSQSKQTWHGRLDEINFLKRLYTLEGIESSDSRFSDAERDIWQHRVGNYDWDDDWIFFDERFKLESDDSSYFLKFLAETLHPEVRKRSDVDILLGLYNTYLQLDGWELRPEMYISGRPVFSWYECQKKEIEEKPNTLEARLEDVIHTVARSFATNGQVEHVHILCDSLPRLEYYSGSTHLGLEISCGLYERLKERERLEILQEEICRLVDEYTCKIFDQSIEYVNIYPKLVSKEGWRKDALEWLYCESSNVSNQGRVRSDNVASRKYDGLLFRSNPEINLYKALKERNVSFAPLPVFIRGGLSVKRIEPDFIILHEGVCMAVEVDGDTFHQESPAKAHERTEMLHLEGVFVERVRAAECSSDERARHCAEKILKTLEKIKRNRR